MRIAAVRRGTGVPQTITGVITAVMWGGGPRAGLRSRLKNVLATSTSCRSYLAATELAGDVCKTVSRQMAGSDSSCGAKARSRVRRLR